MKYIYCFLFSLFIFCSPTISQSTDISDIPVSVFIPKQPNIITNAGISLLESRLQRALTVAGIGGNSNSNDFIIYPIVNYITEELTAGAPTMYIQNQDVSIFLSSWDGEKVYGSCSINLKGAGVSKEKAFLTGIRNLNPNNSELQKMLKEAKIKMLKYYENNCSLLITKAQNLASQRKYGESLSILQSIPSINNPCAVTIQDEMSRIYSEMELYACDKTMIEVEAAIANNNLNMATVLLMEIPSSNNCPDKVNSAIDKLTLSRDLIEEKKWEHMIRIHDDAVYLKSKRLEVIGAVAVSFAEIFASERREKTQDIIINKYEF